MKKIFNRGWMKSLGYGILVLAIGLGSFKLYQTYKKFVLERQVLKQIISRLEADSRIAEVLVTDVQYNPMTQQHMTTIKFLEYDTEGRPMWPKYFTFAGNVIQFQSLVVRFDDSFVEAGDSLRGKSAYLFWKVFVLDGPQTQEYPIAEINAVPEGYKIDGPRNKFEDEIWQDFWKYALDSKKAVTKGIKNAQIEAPGTKFVPGILYTLKIEHDGGIRIDTKEIPVILKGETL
jgi:hypothetical protein